MMKPLTYSLLAAYQTCPRKAYHQQIAYTKFDVIEDREAADYGNEVHKALDHYLKTGERPSGISLELIDGVRNYSAAERHSELHLGMLRSGELCNYYDPACWARGKLDVALFGDKRAVILDWKTGKQREDPLELEFHGMLLRANYPSLTSIQAAYVWLKSEVIGNLYDVSDPTYIREKALEVEEEIKAERFPPTPNHLCHKYCPVITCEHNGKRRKEGRQKVP